MKQIFLFISFIVIGLGLYLKYFYDVPDEQMTINFFTSWFFIIIGIGSLLINIFWTTKNNNQKEL